LPRKINNERYWNGVTYIESLDYDQTCSNSSSDNECKFLTQGTRCLGSEPYKCKCSPGKYFNIYYYRCDYLFEINEPCSQIDSCRNGICMGSPLKCSCLPLQYFDQISGQCQNQLNFSSSSSFSTNSASSTISFTTGNFIYSYEFCIHVFLITILSKR
jgi:hypothetical protein